jgi:hypothetical protein
LRFVISYTVSVVTTFPVSAPKAQAVLERWWSYKEERKQYMRDYRRTDKKAPAK